METQEQRKEKRLNRGCRLSSHEGIHITLTTEAYKLHVKMSAGEVKDGADANKVAIVHPTASTDFGEIEKYGAKDRDIQSLSPPVGGERRDHELFHVGQCWAQQYHCVISKKHCTGRGVKRRSTAFERALSGCRRFSNAVQGS
jgi:hypothetical protein